jgi:hypothetical protein
MRVLLKHKLVHHENVKYDGYRLTPLVRFSRRRRSTPPGGAGWGRDRRPVLRCMQHACIFSPDITKQRPRRGTARALTR